MQSRKYELQQKKLAVRRLSQGSKRGQLSPTGGNPFVRRQRDSAEEHGHTKTLRGGQDFPRGIQHYIQGNKEFSKTTVESKVRDVDGFPKKEVEKKMPETKPLSLTNNPFLSTAAMSILGLPQDAPQDNSKPVPFHEPSTGNERHGNQFTLTSSTGNGMVIKSAKNDLFHGVTMPRMETATEDKTNPFFNSFASGNKETRLASQSMQSGLALSDFLAQKDALQKVNKDQIDLSSHFREREGEQLVGSNGDGGMQTREKEVFAEAMERASDCVAIKVVQVPDHLFDKVLLASHFEQFGPIKRIKLHSKSSSVVITFDDHDSAKKAKDQGNRIKEEQVTIFWYQRPPSGAQIKGVESSKEEVKNRDQKYEGIRQNIDRLINSVGSQRFSDSSSKAEFLGKIDKIIRDGLDKETDLKKAVALRGYCQDMCPERERYLREFQRRLNNFEIVAGTENADTKQGEYPLVDHHRAVKEYSRSSADQEEPLPHEVRPPPILMQTMDFLTSYCMDQGAGRWADWYDFVWNRTRGIRKDITQQDICDEVCVSLLEKCARFHILCSHLLCEESMDCFDPKINNENLTKCLQSLKHMYSDLSEKGIFCPGEPEFRCYQVLLNVNNADILREMMELRIDVRDSKEVKFALEVFGAVNSSNYVRFFKLLRSASFLDSCIMHRYFDQVRGKALLTINRAYVMNQTVAFPLVDMMNWLAFDDTYKALAYLEHYGFPVDESSVFLSKTSYNEPTDYFPVWKSRLINEKLRTSFGEVVNNGPISVALDYTPTISFDETGLYNGLYHRIALNSIFQAEVLDDEDSNDKVEGTVIPFSVSQPISSGLPHFTPAAAIEETGEENRGNEEESTRRPQLSSPPLQITKEDIKESCKELIIRVVQHEIDAIATETYKEEKEVALATCQVMEDVLDKVVVTELRELVSQLYLLEKKRKLEERKKLIDELACEIVKDVLADGVRKELKNVAEETVRLEEQKLMERIRSKEISHKCADIISYIVSEQVEHVVRETLANLLQEKKQNLQSLHDSFLVRRRRTYFLRWFKHFRKQKDLKELLFQFPSMKPLKTSRTSVQALQTKSQGSSTKALFAEGDYLLTSIQRKRERHVNAIAKHHQFLTEERAVLARPLSLERVLKLTPNVNERDENDDGRRSCNLKFILSSPEGENSFSKNRHKVSVENIIKKFAWQNNLEECTWNIDNVETLHFGAHCFHKHKVILAMKRFHGAFSTNTNELIKSRVLYGTCGVIFFLEYCWGEQKEWSQDATRLHNILFSKPSNPSTPLAVVVLADPGTTSEKEVASNLHLDNLKAEELISGYKCTVIPFHQSAHQLEEQLYDIIDWLLEHQGENIGLSLRTMKELMEEGLTNHFFPRVYEDFQERMKTGLFGQDPNSVLALYNGIISHLAEVVSLNAYTSISWPGPEFASILDVDPRWNLPDLLSKMKNTMTCFYLPEKIKMIGNEKFCQQCELCWKYVQLILDDPLNKGQEFLLRSRIEGILSKVKKKMAESSFWANRFPWLPVLEEIIYFTLTTRQITGFFEFKIPFLYGKFMDFKAPKTWENYRDIGRRAMYDRRQNVSHLKEREMRFRTFIDETNEKLNALESSLDCIPAVHLSHEKTDEHESELLRSSNQKLHEFHLSMLGERRAMRRMTDYLNLTVKEELAQDSAVNSKRKRQNEPNAADEHASPGKRFQERNSNAYNDIYLLEGDIDDFVSQLEVTRSDARLDASSLGKIICDG